MKYIVSYQKPNNHYIDIEYIINNVNSDTLEIQLPAWRPGRYELGDFAKNIQKWTALDKNGNTLISKKIKKDLWLVETRGVSEVHVKYNYFANEINAGSSFLDKKQLYVNGVNCFLYIPERINEVCELELILPEEYKVASGLTEVSRNLFETKNFHELVDCPFIASDSLKHHQFKESGVIFNLWFQGECKPDFKLLEKDFKKFCKKQIEAFESFPVPEYHFIFQILTYKTYHGVEHTNSTVISLGPSYDIFEKEELYDELLGVSSHELYHTWNVKQIRPTEMVPYDYSKENYTEMGYLSEGVTTYYGDKFLLSSGAFNWEQYAKTFNQLLTRHYDNFGVKNYSVAQSSFDTWLDGYVKETSGRKGSIYTEGALIAFMTDIFIMQNSNNKKSLNDVMNLLYNDFAKKGIGVSDIDYKNAVEKVANCSFNEIYEHYLHGTTEYTNKLRESLTYIGCDLNIVPSPNYNEAKLGFKVKYQGNKCIVDAIYPTSIAEENGLSIKDEIIAINGIKINNDLNKWCKYFEKEEISCSVKRELGTIEKIRFCENDKIYYKLYNITKEKDNSDNFQYWIK